MSVVVPIQLKIKQALDKIGSTNGTALNIATAPPDLTNEESEKWHNERQMMFDLLVAQQIEAYGKKDVESAKNKMTAAFSKITDTKPGASYGVVRGNVSCNVEVRNGREMLDKAMLVSALAKRGIDLPEVEKIVAESTKITAPAKHFKPSIIQDQG